MSFFELIHMNLRKNSLCTKPQFIDQPTINFSELLTGEFCNPCLTTNLKLPAKNRSKTDSVRNVIGTMMMITNCVFLFLNVDFKFILFATNNFKS